MVGGGCPGHWRTRREAQALTRRSDPGRGAETHVGRLQQGRGPHPHPVWWAASHREQRGGARLIAFHSRPDAEPKRQSPRGAAGPRELRPGPEPRPPALWLPASHVSCLGFHFADGRLWDSPASIIMRAMEQITFLACFIIS